jgi:Amt family ammonium transporter
MKKLFVLLAMLGAFALAAPVAAQDKAPTPPTAEAKAAEPAKAEATASAAAAPAAVASAAAAAPAATAAAPTPNKGDNAWMIVATLLVIMMSIPGLALFYGGLVRSKNMLSVLMQVFVVFSLIIVLWAVYGYSIAFTEGGAFFGGLDRMLLGGIFSISDGSARSPPPRRSARAWSYRSSSTSRSRPPSPRSPCA